MADQFDATVEPVTNPAATIGDEPASIGRSAGRGRGRRSTGDGSNLAASGTGKRTRRPRQASPTARVSQPPLNRTPRAAKPAGTFGGDLFAPLLLVVSSLVAARRGDHWQISQDEASATGAAIANVVRHAPVDPAKLGIAADISYLVAILGGIIGTRLMIDLQSRRHAPSPFPDPAQPRRVIPFAPEDIVMGADGPSPMLDPDWQLPYSQNGVPGTAGSGLDA